MPYLDLRLLKTRIRKDNTIEVKLSVAHNGTTRYIGTGVTVSSPDQFKNGLIVKTPDAAFKNTQLRRFVSKIEDRISSIEYTAGMTCPELVAAILQQDRMPSTVKEIYDEYISTARLSESSIRMSGYCIKSVLSVLGLDFDIRKLGYASIMKLESSLRTAGNSEPTIRTKMALLCKLVVYARRCRYVPYDFRPFDGYTYPDGGVRDSWLTVEQVRHLRDMELHGAMENTTRDLIMLSYCLGGINIADLIGINFNAARAKGFLKFVRKKTSRQKKINKYVEFGIPDEAWKYIDRLKSDDGHIGTEYQRRTFYHHYFSQCMKSLRKQSGIPTLVYYSARKSFAQHAFTLGISTGVIDFILGHKLDRGGTSLYSYISVTPDMATNALRKVLDNLK
ncbi:MAG: hypothetical protein NC411_10305 [Bacteroides sp.]|nr:hypothetical protein [Bacteroides sp.]